jgi:hypothetical protein
MKTLILLLCFFVCSQVTAQPENRPATPPRDFFITTNSGVLNTPMGLKIGFVSRPGLYLGIRTGIGEVYHSDSDLTTTQTTLYSFTTGFNLPVFSKGDFTLIAQFGAGFGHWWSYRWERWTATGFELEGGLMARKKNFLFNITGNVLAGEKTYPAGDLCLGVGFIMNNCK